MTIERLENTRDYFKHITQEAYRQFMDGKVTFLVIYSMATGLYHIAEWMWLHDHPKVKEKFGSEIDSAGALWHKVVEREVPGAGLIRDLNNAAKHAKLKFRKNGGPSTSMHYAANTFIYTSDYGTGRYGVGGYGGAREVKMDEGGREVLLEPIATEVFHFWEKLVDEFHPQGPALAVAESSPAVLPRAPGGRGGAISAALILRRSITGGEHFARALKREP